MALQDGKVLAIDQTLQMIKVEYKDKSIYTYQFGDIITRYSAAGMYINQRVVVHSKLKVGSKFKQHDPIIYNKDFFCEDPMSNNLSWLLGTRVNCAIMDKDLNIDDSNVITRRLGKKNHFTPIYDRQIVLGKDNVIHSFLDIGKVVNPLTPLLVFEEFEDQFTQGEKEYDEETLRVIQSINRNLPTAKTTGTIVDITAIYTSPINTMHPTMQKFLKHIEEKSNKQYRFSKGSANELLPNEPIEDLDKLGTIDVTDDTVIIMYYIKDAYDSKSGDKLVFGSSLKSVTSYVMDDDAYVTEDGEYEIDAIFPALSIFNRMVPETITNGCMSIVLEKIEKDILKMYYGE